jgi:hypothetical protein
MPNGKDNIIDGNNTIAVGSTGAENKSSLSEGGQVKEDEDNLKEEIPSASISKARFSDISNDTMDNTMKYLDPNSSSTQR